jgi:hypothetical protein
VWITPPDESTPTLRKFSLLQKNFNQFMLGYHLVSLIQSDGCGIFDFEQIEAGEVYQSTKSTDRFEKRFASEDQLHEIECGHALAEFAKPEFLDSEVVHNVLVLDRAKIHAQFDAVVFGRTAKETIAIVMEAKFKVHEHDFKEATAAAEKFEVFVKSHASYRYVSTYNPVIISDAMAHSRAFSRFSDVSRVIPCLAGRHFTPEHVQSCSKKGIIPLFPSGARFAVDMLGLLKKI